MIESTAPVYNELRLIEHGDPFERGQSNTFEVTLNCLIDSLSKIAVTVTDQGTVHVA